MSTMLYMVGVWPSPNNCDFWQRFLNVFLGQSKKKIRTALPDIIIIWTAKKKIKIALPDVIIIWTRV